jgi:DNA-binding response OmpR family regulator
MPGARILLVDDSKVLLDSLCFLLIRSGYEVRTAGSAEAALDLLRSDVDIALLITDIGLPRASGWSLAREARAMRADLPVIYVSGHAEEAWYEQGVTGSIFMRKPFGIDDLLGGAARLLSREYLAPKGADSAHATPQVPPVRA